jgi:hypothetical protein
MAQVKIYDQETNSYYTVTFLLKQSILDNTLTGDLDYYLTVNTNLKKDGVAFPTFIVRTLSDVAPGKSTASDFNQLCRDYIDYFTAEAVMTISSSSSSTEGYSSSSSSEGYTSSSSSS